MAPAEARARRTDVLIAVGTAALAIGLQFGLPPLDRADPDGTGYRYPDVLSWPWIVLAVGMLVQSAVLLRARRAPRTTLMVTAVLPAVLVLIAPSTLSGLAMLPVVVAVVLAGLRVPVARLWPTLVATVVPIVVTQTVFAFSVLGAGRASMATGLATGIAMGVLQAVGATGLPMLVVLVVRSRRDVRAARTAEATAVDRQQDAQVDAAIARERAAMARELHDIAAHHLSGIALMSAAIDRQIDSDPERAHEGVRQVRAQSTAVLDDLRRLVGLLREDAPAERLVETVPGIVDLVERSRHRGTVELDVRAGSDRRPLGDGVGPLAQLAAYRTVQEALANAAMHAPGAPCTVRIDDRAADHLVIRIESGAATARVPDSSAAGGNGLRGMRERAELVGARLQAGPSGDGGWLVVLGLDRETR
ncbi:Signal transduction histidine kinase [Curtobacterium sp. 9128]|uniref:sensor histidine kinase n=1 Tax=Curtobacterium sp. 9128 TaxID=1793722 RepID=UPI0007D71049|nr:histidine kinase [Curtobacterium sp. 9128]SBN64247.1 Signal transduction histidine kinase [Curtobacterium sp. 9128]